MSTETKSHPDELDAALREFQPFPKMPRLSRDCFVMEKIDGTNGQIIVLHTGEVLAASRTRLITPQDDNYGFAAWVKEHEEELRTLGPGRHFGEWWGSKIQRGYGQAPGVRQFSLFNVSRWNRMIWDKHQAELQWRECIRAEHKKQEPVSVMKPYQEPPHCCGVVPLIYYGPFNTSAWESSLSFLKANGSCAAPGFKNPEGIVIFHVASGQLFKKTIEGDESHKGQI